MDEALLAFYQQLYAGTPLYVVPEPGTASQPPVAQTPAVAAPAAAPILAASPAPAQPVAPVAPVAAAEPPAPAASAAGGQGKLPSLADLKATRIEPSPAPAPQPVAAPPAAPVLTAAPGPPPAAPVLQQAPPQRPPVEFDTLGSNANGLVMLVRLEDPTRLPRMQRNVFLNNMLKAIQRVMEECVIVNVKSPYPVSLEELRARGLAVREVIGFGKNLLDVATKRTQPYEPVRIGDVAYLPAAEVEMIEYDNGRKKQLWQALQRMFLA
ncbi:hypothetical protein [Hymenobacter latericus]|uniref:hypothetical protein n=1 Tax=Hymenobacter sp. YIM 151858-1 TaxID=2987688 RepID=UPI0022275F28|nr:hypothetical protein [Hymenobacter sp. YIM 151858-1]UYZ60032.1 hypothetical protein OIS50_04350 [Hymenobacter sp. YIM 151858-1]